MSTDREESAEFLSSVIIRGIRGQKSLSIWLCAVVARAHRARVRSALPLFFLATACFGAEPPARVTVPAMKTGIYVGSVTLTPGVFERDGDNFTATYEAKVRPWFFWGETGTIKIRLPTADFARLAKGETVEFTGEAANHKHKPRKVTGRAQPADATSGKIKVRIGVDDVELVFNGRYSLETS
jgi:hypothetical protein